MIHTVILAIWDTEIGRIMVQGQIVHRDPYTPPEQSEQNGLKVWLKCFASVKP
jgi:hypothetical protein